MGYTLKDFQKMSRSAEPSGSNYPCEESVDTESSHDVTAHADASHDPYHEGSWNGSRNLPRVKFFTCSDWLEVSSPVKVAAVNPPSLFAFNYEVIIDVFYIHDMARNLFGFLSIVDNGITFHSISLVCEGQGTPKSSKCFARAQANWRAGAGYPRVVTTDRGLHNRGESPGD